MNLITGKNTINYGQARLYFSTIFEGLAVPPLSGMDFGFYSSNTTISKTVAPLVL